MTTIALNRWALGELAQAVTDVTHALEAYRFNDAANAAYRFVWNSFCDWYVELSKPILTGEDGPAKDETRACIAYVIDEIARLLHPFMPFLTEELWGLLGAQGPKREAILALSAWPDVSGLGDADSEAEIGWLVDLVSDIRSARAETNVPGSAQIPLVLVAASSQTKERAARWSDMIKRLARVSDVVTADVAPSQSIGLVIRGEVVALPLEGIIDIPAERQRLNKEIEKIDSEAVKIENKLANADFMARAPEEVVDEQRERLEAAGSNWPRPCPVWDDLVFGVLPPDAENHVIGMICLVDQLITECCNQMGNVDPCHRIGTDDLDQFTRPEPQQCLTGFERGQWAFKPFEVEGIVLDVLVDHIWPMISCIE